MKKLLIGAVLLAASAAASAQFEGVADFKITTNAGEGETMPGTGKIYVTRSAYRMQMETELSGLRRDRKGASKAEMPEHVSMTMFGKVTEPDLFTMVDDANRTYSIWDLKKMRGQHKGPKVTYTVQKGGSDTVAGLACQKAVLTSSQGSQIDVCVAKDFAVSSELLAAMNRRQSDGGSWIRALQENGLGGFPVRWAMRPKGAKEASTTMELTRLEKKRLPASLFEVPAGYRQTDYAIGGLSPEQEKAMQDSKAQMNEALEGMTPEQRKQFEEMMKRQAPPPQKP